MDGRLGNLNDLIRLHGVNLIKIKGYIDLDKNRKDLFERFIVNFFNAWGLQARSTMKPISIYTAREIYYTLNDEGESIYQILKNGKWQNVNKNDGPPPDEEYTDTTTSEEYFRFEYKIYKSSSWVKIDNDHSWG